MMRLPDAVNTSCFDGMSAAGLDHSDHRMIVGRYNCPNQAQRYLAQDIHEVMGRGDNLKSVPRARRRRAPIGKLPILSQT